MLIIGLMLRQTQRSHGVLMPTSQMMPMTPPRGCQTLWRRLVALAILQAIITRVTTPCRIQALSAERLKHIKSAIGHLILTMPEQVLHID